MAKKKAGKVIQMLSPANYIKARARTLPVYECWVNTEWDKEQLASLVVARRHTNGNITAGLYLVDLMCLGVKDTHFLFNVSETEYREALELFLSMDEGVKKISYELAHNIVYAGLEFAENYKFNPHKDFTAITQYILEEDTDAIPLMEIECGIEGLPALFPETFEDKKALNRIIAHLEKETGKNGFLLLGLDGRLMNDLDHLSPDFELDENDDMEEFEDWSLEEKKELFKELFNKFKKLSSEESTRFFDLTESISDDLIDEEMYEDHFRRLTDYVSYVTVNDGIIPDELLAAQPGQLSEQTKQRFVNLLGKTLEPKEHKKQLKLFKEEKGLEAAISFLEFAEAVSNNKEKQAERLIKELESKYSHYHLVKLKNSNSNSTDNQPTLHEPEHFFGSRTELHPIEFLFYLEYLTLAIVSHTDFNELCAWKEVVYDLPDTVHDKPTIIGLITIIQIQIVADFIESQADHPY